MKLTFHIEFDSVEELDAYLERKNPHPVEEKVPEKSFMQCIIDWEHAGRLQQRFANALLRSPNTEMSIEAAVKLLKKRTLADFIGHFGDKGMEEVKKLMIEDGYMEE